MDADNDVDNDDLWFWWMHDERWRQIATFRGDDDDPKERFVYHAAGLDGLGGSSYIDAVVLRDKDNSDRWRNESDGVLEQRRYICQTWRNDTALIATDVGALVEATKFAGYGESFNVPAGDVNSDGDWDAGDSAAITGGYDVNKDIDMDGSVGAADITAADAVASGYHVEGRGVLSADEVAIRKGYAGYESEPILLGSDLIAAIHHVRNRVLSSYTGRSATRDVLQHPEFAYLYSGSPMTHSTLELIQRPQLASIYLQLQLRVIDPVYDSDSAWTSCSISNSGTSRPQWGEQPGNPCRQGIGKHWVIRPIEWICDGKVVYTYRTCSRCAGVCPNNPTPVNPVPCVWAAFTMPLANGCIESTTTCGGCANE